jgi:hypothetical protein
MAARRKDPWSRPRKDDWISPGKRIIPIPRGVFVQRGQDPNEADWSLLTDTTDPEKVPAFVIDQVRPNGTVMFHQEAVYRPSTIWRPVADILEKWRPAPDPPKRPRRVKNPKPEPEPVVLSRFEREDVI